MQNITNEGVENTEKLRKANEPSENSKTNNTNQENDDWKKNYLDDRLEEGEDKKEIIIRILPIDKNSNTAFKIVKMHNMRVPTEIAKSGWKKYICLSENDDIDHEKFGNKCPICELRYEAFKRSKDMKLDKVERDKWYNIGKSNFTNEYCIIRCIERGHEEDGPKFWKFAIKKDSTDPYHVIRELDKARRDEKIAYGVPGGENWSIFDNYNGKDLKIVITEQKQEGNAKVTKKGVSVMDYGPECPISKNHELMEKWVDDEKKWSDVFTVKPYEYLKIISEGNVPFFDRSQNKWVEKLAKGEKTENKEVKDESNAEAKANSATEVESVENTSDLPF